MAITFYVKIANIGSVGDQHDHKLLSPNAPAWFEIESMD
jgi:hypothetical protein